MFPPPLFVAGTAAVLAAAPAEDLLARPLSWRVVNDTVMGGVSKGAVALEGGQVVFAGQLSLDNNGGFASVRSTRSSLGLSDATGLAVTVRGDGRTWWLTLGTQDRPLGAGSYRAPLPTRAGEETTVELAFADFRYTAYGRPVRGAPPLAAAPERIDSLGVLLSDKQPGPFRIALVAVQPLAGKQPLVSEPSVPQAQREALVQSLSAALRLGVPAFNAGNPGRCRAHYQTAVESALLLGADALRPSERQDLVRALQRSEALNDTDAAWELREAMDRILLR